MSYNEDYIMQELSDLTPGEISSKFTKDQLKSMFRTLYNGLEPRSSCSKLDLAHKIWDFISDSNRTKDLFKNIDLYNKVV